MRSDINDLQDNPGEETLFWSFGHRDSKNNTEWTRYGPHSWLDFIKNLRVNQPGRRRKEYRPFVGGTMVNDFRSKATMEARSLLTLDADSIEDLPDFLLDLETTISSPYLFHSTWSHTTRAPRLRLIMPLDRPVSPSEYTQVAWAVMNRLGGDQFDKTTAQAERFMYSPSVPNRTAKLYIWGQGNGGSPYLPVDEVLRAAQRTSQTPEAGTGSPATPTPPATGSGAHTALEVTDEHRERAEELLEQAVHGVEMVYESNEFAGRNEAVFHMLPQLLRFAAAGALDADLVLERLWEASQEVEAPDREPYTREEFNVSVRKAREYVEETGPQLPESIPTERARLDFADVEVETEVDLWQSTERLRRVAQAADNMGVSRLAFLVVLLSRVLAEVPPEIKIPGAEDGAIGARAAINLGVMLVALSGQGKSSIFKQTKTFFDDREPAIWGEPSTGQGLLQAYQRYDKEEGVMVNEPDMRGLFYIDEVETLMAMSADKTSTTTARLRSMIMGEQVSDSNATAERKRRLAGGSYRFCIVIAAQPALTDFILKGKEAGTPQRFVWVQAVDPKTRIRREDKPEYPGPLMWDDSFLDDLNPVLNDPVVQYPQWMKERIQDLYDKSGNRELEDAGEEDWASHRALTLLKVATGIAFLHESTEVTDEYLEIAEQVMKGSDSVQRRCRKIVSDASHRKDIASILMKEQAETAATDRNFKGHIDKIAGKIKDGKGDWLVWRDFRPQYAVSKRYGDDVIWEALHEHENVECQGSVEGRDRKARWKK